jgi:signal transduction histidine kinase
VTRRYGRAALTSPSRWRLSGRSADRLLVLGLLAWALFDVPWWWRPPGHRGSALVILGTLALAAAQSVPFRWRRRQPVAVLALACACLGIKYAAGLNLWSAGVAVLVAGYGLGACGSRPVRQAARVLAGAALLAAVVALQAQNGNHGPAVACALLATALVLGEVASSHRDVAAAAARHAQDRERASIARELHDVVAHQLSAIAVQAGAARLASAGDPDIAAAAVAAIEQEARRGLVELNHLVGALRQRSAGPPEVLPEVPSEVPSEVPPETPSEARLGSVGGLVERARGAGVAATLVVEGEPRQLPAAVDLAGYRVVQEGLTNAIRHARGSSALVRLCYLDDGIVVEIADDGPAAQGSPSGQGEGFGLTGLSERARLLGGEFEAGRGADRGFVVRAYLPDAR